MPSKRNGLEAGRRGMLVSLHDSADLPLYPELMVELDAIKRTRIAGLLITRDFGDRCPRANITDDGECDLN